jgi:hypothetical protein
LARARKLSSRIQSLDDVWTYALGRPPTPRERETADAFLAKRLGGQTVIPSALSSSPESPAQFREKTGQERLLDQNQVWEGDEFTVEAVVSLDSVDAAAAVRTIASRWTGGKDSLEAYGWSLGVTGEKSRFKPRNLIVQLVGEDENSNIGYEVVASNLRLELGRRYHLVVSVSCSEHSVSFRMRDLDQPDAPVQSVTVPHVIRGKLGYGSSSLVVAGLYKRAPQHQWDGEIHALRVVSGRVSETEVSPDPKRWGQALARWTAESGPGTAWVWSGDGKSSEGSDARRQALNDLCQVLLNSNEFLYLH